MADFLCDAARDFEAVRVLADQNRVIENLRADIEMQAANFYRIGCEQRIEYRVDRLFIHTEWRGLAAHAHGAALNFGGGIYADCDVGAFAEAAADADDTFGLARRFDVKLADAVRQD